MGTYFLQNYSWLRYVIIDWVVDFNGISTYVEFHLSKVLTPASQAVTMETTRDIYGYERAHLSSHCPDDPPLCKTWPLRAVDLRKLEVFDNDCLRYILQCCRIDRVCTTTLRRRLNLRHLPPIPLQRRLRWFGHAARLPEGELIRDVLLPSSLPNWWAAEDVGQNNQGWPSSIIKHPSFRRRNHDRLAITCDLAQDQRTWAAMVRDAVLAREEAGSTRPGWKPLRVKSSLSRVIVCLEVKE